MLGAAVARHYACGTSTFRGSFPKGALMNIRRHGGDVLTGKRVVALIEEMRGGWWAPGAPTAASTGPTRW